MQKACQPGRLFYVPMLMKVSTLGKARPFPTAPQAATPTSNASNLQRRHATLTNRTAGKQ